MEALVTLPGHKAGVQTVEIPAPSAGQIRVRVKAIALNPVDALYVAKPAFPPGRVVGSDFAGVVHAVGEDAARRWKIGDRVAGFLHGACQENVLPGAFTEYLVIDADLVYGVPPSINFGDAATIPLCGNTAVNGLFRVLGLPAPWSDAAPSDKPTRRPAILIYSGATSVGCYAIQLARLSPIKPLIITTASPSNESLLKSHGADHVIDYHETVWVDNARTFLKNENAELLYALDCISEDNTVETVSWVFDGPGKIATVRGPTQWSHGGIKNGVKAEYMAVWTMLGKEFWYNGGVHFPAEPTHRSLAAAFYKYLSNSNPNSPLHSGLLKPNRVRFMTGGLKEVPDSFVLLGTGKVRERIRGPSQFQPLRAEKMVYNLETD